jgi:hypothetical protein
LDHRTSETLSVGRVWQGLLRPQTLGRYAANVSISADQLRALGARVRAEAEAAGELATPGPSHWDIPQEGRDALLEYLHSGAYEEAARASIADEPEL